MSLKGFTKQDFEKALEECAKARKLFMDFYSENKIIVDKFEELKDDCVAMEWRLKEIAEEVAPKNPHLFAENGEVEVRIKNDGLAQIFYKDLYKKNEATN